MKEFILLIHFASGGYFVPHTVIGDITPDNQLITNEAHTATYDTMGECEKAGEDILYRWRALDAYVCGWIKIK